MRYPGALIKDYFLTAKQNKTSDRKNPDFFKKVGVLSQLSITLSASSFMNYWLMKSEPDVYGIANLERDRSTIWDGVRNYQARNFLKSMAVGDRAFFYHSNTNPPGIVGLMEIIEAQVVDPSQFDIAGEYYDPKSTLTIPRWHTVKVEFVKVFDRQITLAMLRETFSPEELLVVKQGNRLSVMPIDNLIATQIIELTID
jgi:predicted RNA-binding protein with PUA-like domain